MITTPVAAAVLLFVCPIVKEYCIGDFVVTGDVKRDLTMYKSEPISNIGGAEADNANSSVINAVTEFVKVCPILPLAKKLNNKRKELFSPVTVIGSKVTTKLLDTVLTVGSGTLP